MDARGAKRSHQHRRTQLLKLLRTHFAPTDAVIVYCTRQVRWCSLTTTPAMALTCATHVLLQCECWLQAQVDEIAGYLQSNGINAAPYHAGRTAFSRTEVQSSFATGSISVVVATIAFGLGIDKADVRGVIHYSLPKSLENYVQVRGRVAQWGSFFRFGQRVWMGHPATWRSSVCRRWAALGATAYRPYATSLWTRPTTWRCALSAFRPPPTRCGDR